MIRTLRHNSVLVVLLTAGVFFWGGAAGYAQGVVGPRSKNATKQVRGQTSPSTQVFSPNENSRNGVLRYESAQQVTEVTYEDGVMISERVFKKKSGEKISERHFRNGGEIVLSRSFYPDGTLAAETRFKEGGSLGEIESRKVYYSNGQLKYEIFNGEYWFYDEAGNEIPFDEGYAQMIEKALPQSRIRY